MSEYQYYEFQAVDRSLDESEMAALRRVSSRARITSRSFANHYNWGDLRANPKDLMKTLFDLHLYVSNWGTRRLMIRLPKRLVDLQRMEHLLRDHDLAEISGCQPHDR